MQPSRQSIDIIAAQAQSVSTGATSGIPTLISVVVAAILVVSSGDWTLAVAIIVFALGWKYLTRHEPTPAAAAAFTFHWLQVTIAMIYAALLGRQISWMTLSNWKPMVILALASMSVLFGGYYLASRTLRKSAQPAKGFAAFEPSLFYVFISYVVSILMSVTIKGFAWRFSGLTQILMILSLARYVLLYMLVSRLLSSSKPRWTPVFLILASELILGFAGFFANFREPLAFVTLAIIATSGKRRVRTLVIVALLACVAVVSAVTWTAIKPIIRENYASQSSTTERLQTVVSLIGPTLGSRQEWEPQVDRFVARMWAIYFPALALERVPEVVPYERGKLLWDAIKNIINPRFFFPEKGILASDSDKVRKYTGLWVAGRETNTSYAFGYAAESYVDFGIPLMFLPIFAFGALVGFGDRMLHRMLRSQTVLQGVRAIFLWVSLYLFEVSWAMMLGTSIGAFLVLGIGGMLYEQLLGVRKQIQPASPVLLRVGARS